MRERLSRGVVHLTLLLAALGLGRGQQLTIGSYQVQVHGFFSQGFAYSDANNVLTMPTSRGTFAMTDAGLNVSSDLSDKLRVGAQAYTRNIGELGKGHVEIDWAQADYRVNDYFGFRVGKVKTVSGLYNDTSDFESLQTWALMPQSLYPLDGRTGRISHWGGDVYGQFPGGRLGAFSYTVYGGALSADVRDGYTPAAAALGIRLNGYSGPVAGGDVRLQTKWPGLVIGTSMSMLRAAPDAYVMQIGKLDDPSHQTNRVARVYGQYVRGKLRLDAELEGGNVTLALYKNFGAGPMLVASSLRRTTAWYGAIAYRLNEHWEVGTYHSRFYPGLQGAGTVALPWRRIADQAVTVRLDVNRFIDLKVEEHFTQGYGDPGAFHEFYFFDNPQGLKPDTNLCVVRLGVSF